MPTINIPSNSATLILDGHVITNFAEGDFIELNFVNPLTDRKNGANGGVNIIERIDGTVGTVIVRIQGGSDDDVLLLNFSKESPAHVFNGSCKEDYTKDGTSAKESWTLENGTFTIMPSIKKNNQTRENAVEYTIEFRNMERSI